MKGKLDFNPRSPHGERQPDERCNPSKHGISIHAPRTGSDRFRDSNFQIPFQSTLPARGATQVLIVSIRNMGISIHAPRTGSDMDL